MKHWFISRIVKHVSSYENVIISGARLFRSISLSGLFLISIKLFLHLESCIFAWFTCKSMHKIFKKTTISWYTIFCTYEIDNSLWATTPYRCDKMTLHCFFLLMMKPVWVNTLYPIFYLKYFLKLCHWH